MQLVDSNVVFALLVEGAVWHAAARALYERDPDWRTESHALVEIGNVLSRYVRVRELSASQAVMLMTEATDRFGPRIMSVSHVEALQVALRSKVSAYDARFLVCAAELGTPLVTEDAKLRRAAPRSTRSLDDALAAPSRSR